MDRITLPKRMVIAFVCLVLLPFLGLIAGQDLFFAKQMESKIIHNASLIADQYSVRLESTLKSIEKFMNQLRANKNLRTVVETSEIKQLHGDTQIALYKFVDDLNLYLSTFNINMYSICLANRSSIICQLKNGPYPLQPGAIADLPFFAAAMDKKGVLNWDGSFVTDTGIPLLTVSCGLYGNASFAIQGSVHAAFSMANIFPASNPEEPSEILLFYHPENSIVYTASEHRDALLSAFESVYETGGGRLSLDGDSYLIVSSNANEYGWHVIYALPTGQVFYTINMVALVFVGIATVCFCMAILYLRHIQVKLLRPLQSAIAFINDNTLHTMTLKSGAHGYPELRLLRQKVASLVEEKQTAECNLEHVSQQKNLAQIKHMQMQINPHFLYNTLNSIKILADMGRSGDVSRLIYHLVHLLNACMDRSGLFVSVQKELETLRHYCAIQETVYGEAIRFEIRTNPELDSCQIPNFILQPIVENSLQHGLNQAQPDSWVRITNRIEAGALLFEISDNGIGIPPAKLQQIIADMQSDAPSAHIGIRSVHRRIQLSCGMEYGIWIDSAPGKGATFVLRLPFVEKYT